jgi:DNA-directed RNA polymerase sigma subunit (sigma70/sigma32)
MYPSSEESYEVKERITHLLDIVDSVLSEQEKHILLGNIVWEKTFKILAEHWGMPPERARQIRNRSIHKLRYHLKEM